MAKRKLQGGRRKAEGGKPDRSPCAPFSFRRPPSAFHPRRGLTLIELLVTIVIMVTLLAAVLPAVSPNNEGRKIREASRQLSSLFAQAQSQAARDGRSVGVGFEDFDGDGIALEAYLVAEPAPFAGFSESAAVLVDQQQRNSNTLPQLDTNPQPTVPPDPNDINPPFNITFGHNVGGEAFICDGSDPLPPSTFRVGDVVEVGREQFEIIETDLDDIDDTDNQRDADEEDPAVTNPLEFGFLQQQHTVAVRWLTRKQRPNDLLPPGGRAFRIRRQPASAPRIARTPAATLQFPRGVGIDLFASGVEPALHAQHFSGNPENYVYEYGFTTMQSAYRTQYQTPLGDPKPFVPNATPRDPLSVAIMFSPTGQLNGIVVNGERLDSRITHVHLLIGRIENGNVDPEDPDLDFQDSEVPTDSDGDAILRERRTRFNWLNADSRLVNVDGSSGRVLATDVAVPDPRRLQAAIASGLVTAQIPQQIGASRQFAEAMER